MADRTVVHLLGPSAGGIRRHVRYLAAHPPEGWAPAGVVGPPSLAGYFEGCDFVPFGRRAFRRLRRAGLVHAHGLRVGAYALLPRGLRPPVVVTFHMDLASQARTADFPSLQAIAPLVARRAEGAIAVSSRIAGQLRGAVFIPPAVDPLPPPARARDAVRAELGASTSDVVILALARLHADKRVDVFIDAIGGSGAVGWVAGDGPERARLEPVAEAKGVRLLGYRTDVADLLASADALAIPSRGEGYPIAVVEALTAGVPVIGTRVGAIEEMARDAALLVDPGDVQGFGDAVRRFASDPELRARLRAAAAARVLPGPRELVERVGAVYASVTA